MLTTFSALAAEHKRVLVVHSFGNAAPPFTTASTAFETALTEGMGEGVDLDEVSLDVARYASLDMDEAVVELMRKRQTKWQPDLVVPIGAPAGIFVAKHRDRLFPATTPIIYTALDQRRLPAGALEENATFVGTLYDYPGAVKDILQLAPDTTNVVMLLGDSELERFWVEFLKQEFQPLTNRVSFTWFNKLSFEQILERSAKLPPHSFMLMILYMKDGSGVTHNADEALRQIHSVANAPINGLFRTQMGLGVVGGSLYADELEASESARVAIRVLRGEPVSNFPPRIMQPSQPQYDWRELQRWNIPESRLPAGSKILFRQPSVWVAYKWYLLGIFTAFALETVLVSLLILNLVKRHRAERAFRETEQRLNLAAAAAEIGMWMWDIAPNEIWATENCRRMFGFPARAVLRYETFLQRVHPKDRAAVELAVRHALEDGNDYVSEYRVILPDGVERWVTARGRPEVTGNGETKRLLGACVDVTTRKRAEETAQQLSGRLLHAHEEERARLAKELHDGLSQNLALLSVEMEMFGQRLPETPAQINERLSGFSSEAKGLSAEVHRISHGLHPAKLTQLGLTIALRSFCREVEQAHGIQVCFEARDVPRELPPEAALCLYRVAQEAIQNVVKHSGAKRATVELETTGNTICLRVTDDGKGFETGAKRGSGSLGLVSMQERVRLVQGKVSVKSEPGQGTRVEARVPLPKECHI